MEDAIYCWLSILESKSVVHPRVSFGSTLRRFPNITHAPMIVWCSLLGEREVPLWVVRYQIIGNTLTGDFITATPHFLFDVRVCLGVIEADGTLISWLGGPIIWLGNIERRHNHCNCDIPLGDTFDNEQWRNHLIRWGDEWTWLKRRQKTYRYVNYQTLWDICSGGIANHYENGVGDRNKSAWLYDDRDGSIVWGGVCLS